MTFEKMSYQQTNFVRLCKLTDTDMRILRTGKKLENRHIAFFHTLLLQHGEQHGKDCALFVQDCNLGELASIKPVPIKEEVLQIIDEGDHWVCCYYKEGSILIYDSLNKKELSANLTLILGKLFPSLDLQKAVSFPNVQKQTNEVDSGLFAIANAITCLKQGDPEKVSYDRVKMRSHLLKKIFETGEIKIFPTEVECNFMEMEFDILLPADVEILQGGEMLEDTHIAVFHTMLKINHGYFVQNCSEGWLESIIPVPLDQKLIQVIHLNAKMHWVCCHYNNGFVYIYDSLDEKTLSIELKRILLKLSPTFDLLKSVKLPNVKQQPNSVDCGVFAIANAITCLFKENPKKIEYDFSLMRKHLFKILKTGKITPFPKKKVSAMFDKK